MLVQGLPPGAAMWTHEQEGWSQTDHLIAALIETVAFWGRASAQPHYKDRLPDPARVPRPGVEAEPERPKGRVVTSLKELGAFIRRHS